jgi:RNA polymerase sigma-70 factor (TIGR02960 family)
VSEAVLQRARAGDDDAFRDLTAPYLGELRLHCYRILGSFTDAEDLLQETLLAAWRGLDGFAGRGSLRTWLYRIATNRCLNAMRRRRPPELPAPFAPPEPSRRGEVTWLQPYPDTLLEQVADPALGPEARYTAREATELAFITALQRLPPRQAAVLVLRDVLGYSTDEVADLLDTSPTAVKGLLQRARTAVGPPSPADRQPGSAAERDLASRFADVFTADDIDGVVALLTDDAWLAMPPAPHEYHGPAAIASFLRASLDWRRSRRLRLVATSANTQPAYGLYLTDPEPPVARFAGLLVLTVTGDRISAITRFLDPDLASRFRLPATWE